MQQLPLFLFTWPHFPGGPWKRHRQGQEESTASLKPSAVVHRARCSTTAVLLQSPLQQGAHGPAALLSLHSAQLELA